MHSIKLIVRIFAFLGSLTKERTANQKTAKDGFCTRDRNITNNNWETHSGVQDLLLTQRRCIHLQKEMKQQIQMISHYWQNSLSLALP